jgi:hypothetical protein
VVRAAGRAAQEKNRAPKIIEAHRVEKKVLVFTVIYRRNSRKSKAVSKFD